MTRLAALLLALALAAAPSATRAETALKVAFVEGNEIHAGPLGGPYAALTHDRVPKSLPVWSKDGTRIAFLRATASARALARLVVVDEAGRPVADILVRPATTAPIVGLRFVETIEWLSAGKIALGGSVNPSTAENVILALPGGAELLNFFEDGPGAAFSPDGAHAAYMDGSPHFAPEDARAPTLRVDGEAIYPRRGEAVRFLGAPCWSEDGARLAVLAEDGRTKAREIVLWARTGALAILPANLPRDSQIILSWHGGNLFAAAGGQAWRVEKAALRPAPLEAEAEAHAAALLEKAAAAVEAAGGRDPDFWCADCALRTLPRRVTVGR